MSKQEVATKVEIKPSDYRCRIYIRVSTQGQADPVKSSLQEQEKICRQIIDERGWTPVDDVVFQDVESGGAVETRDGINAALEEARRGSYNLLVAYSFDRLSRSAGDTLNFALRDFPSRNVQIYTCKENPPLDPPNKFTAYNYDRLLTLTISAFVSQGEIISSRLRYWQGMKGKVERGELPHPKTPPYGYRSHIDKTAVKNSDKGGYKIKWIIRRDSKTAPVVQRIFSQYLAGKSYRAIAKGLNDDGVPTPRYKQLWSYSTVQIILENPAYAGRVRWQWKKSMIPRHQKKQPKQEWVIHPGDHPSIIEPEQFDAVQRLIEIKKRLPGRFSQGKALLSGIIRCGQCKKKMWACSATQNAPAYYKCPMWHQFRKCTSTLANMERVDMVVMKSISGLVKDKTKFISVLEGKRTSPKPNVQAVNILETQRAVLEKSRNRYLKAYGDSLISAVDMNKSLKRIDEELSPIVARINELNALSKEYTNALKAGDKIRTMGDALDFLKRNKSAYRTYLLDLLESIIFTANEQKKYSLEYYFR